MSYTTLSVLEFTEGLNGWRSNASLADGTSPTPEVAAELVTMFDTWLAANTGADNAQFHWRLFEFCIIAGNKTKAATALETAIAKGRALSAEVLAEAQAKVA
jgi:hypothetical protein